MLNLITSPIASAFGLLPSYVWLVLVLSVVWPIFGRRYGRAFGLPGRIVGCIWRGAVSLFRLPPISHAIDRITPAGVDSWLARRAQGSRDPLLSGDRLGYARRFWPPARYPTLYQSIPADVRRSVVWDGRLIGNREVTWLGWRHISAEAVAGVMKAAGRMGLRAGAVAAVLVIALSIVRTVAAGYSAPVAFPHWSVGFSIMPRVDWYLLVAVDVLLKSASGIILAIVGAALLIPAYMFFAFWHRMHGFWREANSALATPTRDSLVIYKAKADIRAAEYLAYCRQVSRSICLRQDQQPTFVVGKATGVLRARGDMEAPEGGQDVCLDGDSIRQHTLILGGTGSGKTRLAVKPLFERVMAADWGYRNGVRHRIGAYVTDGKGTLWQDLQRSSALAGRSDVVIVGTADGQKAIDPLKGMTALEVATTLKAVSGQVMGAPVDDFWPEPASLLMLHCATIARVLDLDEQTVQSSEWRSCRPWSLLGVGRLATDAKANLAALKTVVDLGSEDPVLLPDDLRAAIHTPEVHASVDWLQGSWATMPSETKGSIVANVNIILGKLGGAGRLRERFCTGLWTDTVDIDHALKGGVLMLAVGETEWGMVGKVISVWLKTRLYIEARKRLQYDPEACRNVSCAMFADEWQMLATTGPDSDASFWNVARETGVFLIAATQSLAALKQVLGDDATANIINLLRTKIVLKTEEVGTLDYCIKLAGETQRGLVLDDCFFETQGQREIERPDIGARPDLSETISVGNLLPTFPRLSTGSMRPAITHDVRFAVSPKGLGYAVHEDAVRSSKQAAYWRQEDKEKEAKGAALAWRPKITTDELLLGSGMAFAIVQRAGCDRSDIIDLEIAA
jgi:hypothetical protein